MSATQRRSTLLRDHRDKLDRLAHTLLEKETLDEEEAYAAAGVQRPTGEQAAVSTQA